MRTRYFLEAPEGDTTTGGGGADTTAGGAGADTTAGAGGADTTQGGGGQDTTSGAGGKDTTASWPADWRERVSANNAEDMKTLQRFADPAMLWKSYAALRQKVSTGELKAQTPFPDKGTAEEQAAWRKEQGVPDKPEAYDLTLDNGVVIGEEDKPLVGEFLKFAHASHQPNSAVKKTLEWFLGDYREGLEAQRAEAEANMLREAEDTLRQDWGADYRPNMSAIQGLLDAHVSAESGLKERILKSIKLEPEFAKLWANLARQINPVSTLTGIDPARMEGSINDEIAQIETFMRTNRAAYNKDERKQLRLRELYAARERLKTKA